MVISIMYCRMFSKEEYRKNTKTLTKVTFDNNFSVKDISEYCNTVEDMKFLFKNAVNKDGSKRSSK